MLIMNINFSKITLFALLLPFSLFTSCSLEDPNAGPEIIIDPPTYSYLTIWKEVERREGAGNWQTVVNADSLALFLNDTQSTRPRKGAYIYNPHHLKIEVDTTGAFVQKDSLFLFLSVPNLTDTMAVNYKISGDSLLLINKSVDPHISMKYLNVDKSD